MSNEYEKLKLNELRDLAKEKGIRGISTMRKPELIAVLNGQKESGGKVIPVSKPEVKKPDRSPEKTARNHGQPKTFAAAPAGSQKCTGRR